MVKKIGKIETVEEFLARGGKVEVVPAIKPEEKGNLTAKSMASGPPNLLTYGEADQYYGEKKKRKKKPVDLSEVNVACLPEELRKKLGL